MRYEKIRSNVGRILCCYKECLVECLFCTIGQKFAIIKQQNRVSASFRMLEELWQRRKVKLRSVHQPQNI